MLPGITPGDESRWKVSSLDFGRGYELVSDREMRTVPTAPLLLAMHPRRFGGRRGLLRPAARVHPVPVNLRHPPQQWDRDWCGGWGAPDWDRSGCIIDGKVDGSTCVIVGPVETEENWVPVQGQEGVRSHPLF